MIEKYYFEFSKLYGRLMRLEMQIKKMLISSVQNYYAEDCIEVFDKFFKNKERLSRYSGKNGNFLLAIIKNPQMNNMQKFKNLINKLYLSDLLFLILHCEQFQIQEITENFYFKIPEKFGSLVSQKKFLLELRNIVAYYNFKDYEKKKIEYLNTLLLFEVHMGHNIKGVLTLPNLGNKPSIRNILVKISEIRPDLLEINPEKDDEMEYYYNKHRVLMDLCDEIAIYNGYDAKELPSPWTIFRQMYEIKKELKTNTEQDIKNLPLFQQL